MQTDPRFLRAEDGVEIALYHWRAAGDAPVRGIVQISHGMAEHAGRYARFAGELARIGWSVIASDHRGHGKTAKDDASLGHFADEHGWSKVIGDLRTVAAHARREHPGVPLILFGHSMGSFLAQALALRDPSEIDGLVLSGSTAGGGLPALAGRQLAKLERARQGKRGRSALLRYLTFGQYNRGFEGRTDYDWLSRDPIEVDRYVADPRCGFTCTDQLWIDVLGGLSELGRGDWTSAARTLPIYVMSGERDPVGEHGKGVRRLLSVLRRAGAVELTERLYPDARHELLNETNRDEVTADLVRWIAARAAPSRAG